MTENRSVDFETFRKTRAQRFGDWRRDLIGRISQRGWVEAEAEVTACKPVRNRYRAVSRAPGGVMTGYAVTFTYAVNGKSYDGIVVCPDQVEKQDKFVIRYNPSHPEENNTFDSESDVLFPGLMKVYDVLLVLALVVLLVIGWRLGR